MFLLRLNPAAAEQRPRESYRGYPHPGERYPAQGCGQAPLSRWDGPGLKEFSRHAYILTERGCVENAGKWGILLVKNFVVEGKEISGPVRMGAIKGSAAPALSARWMTVAYPGERVPPAHDPHMDKLGHGHASPHSARGFRAFRDCYSLCTYFCALKLMGE
jgi:hypothetical protein